MIAAPIRIAAYGEGRLPRILDGFHDSAALRLSDQQFWEIESLDVSGSTKFGVLVESSSATMHHIVLRDLLVHNAPNCDGCRWLGGSRRIDI